MAAESNKGNASKNTVWKSFEDNQITHSAAHYLMAIKHLLETQGYARVTDIARRLNITRGSCSISLKTLKERELVLTDNNRHLLLSEEGNRLAQMVELNDELLERLFRDVLGVDADQAEIDACKIEHLISLDTTLKLAHFLHCWDEGGKEVQKLISHMDKLDRKCSGNVATCKICKASPEADE